MVKENDQTVFYAQSDEYCPVSVQVTLTLDNMFAQDFNDGIFIVPAFTGKYKLFALERVKRGKISYTYNYKAVYGDVDQTVYDQSYLYDLPYRKNARFRIEQGYNGRFTHQNENSLDFNMPEGTEVHAARAGVVIAIEQHFTETCLREECKKMNNYVLIYHSDGTIADYSHIQYQGARVRVGDVVKKGDLIAMSGSTGYARGPHLHFVCFLPDFDKRRTVKTKFRIGDGRSTTYLSEDRTYTRSYK